MRTSAPRQRMALRLTRPQSTADVRMLISELLDAVGLDRDERIEVLGGALVTEAVRPYWDQGFSADESHAELQVEDPELSEVVEAISPMLMGRAEARELSRQAIEELETLLRGQLRP